MFSPDEMHHVEILQPSGISDHEWSEDDSYESYPNAYKRGRELTQRGYVVRIQNSRGRIEWEG